jgi:putative nucleotidyltransferase with HDIG domain
MDATRILIVEPDGRLRLYLSELVRRCGWEPLEGAPERELAAQVGEAQPRLVLGSLAPTFEAALRALEGLPAAAPPVIIVNLLGHPDQTVDALLAGAADYAVRTDLSVDGLREKIAGFLEAAEPPEAGTTVRTLTPEWRSTSGIPAEVDPAAIRARLKAVRDLAVLSPVAQQLAAIVESEETMVKDLVRVISADPGLASRLLAFANSAFYRGTRPFTSIERAVVRIGFGGVRTLALAISLLELQDDGKGLSVAQVYDHSVATAALCEGLARASGFPEPDQAFLCGLLHDIGKVILKQGLRREALRIRRWARQRDLPAHRVEFRVLAMDHGRVGEMMLEQWKIPRAITRPIACHHDPQLAMGDLTPAERKLATILYVCDNLAKAMQLTADAGDALEFVGFDHVEWLGMEGAAIESALRAARKRMEELRRLLLQSRLVRRESLLSSPPPILLVRESNPAVDVLERFLRETGSAVTSTHQAPAAAELPAGTVVVHQVLDVAAFRARAAGLRDLEGDERKRLRRHLLVGALEIPRDELNAARARGIGAVAHPVSVLELARLLRRAAKAAQAPGDS